MLLRDILLARLRACNYDLSKLSAAQRAEVDDLARAAGIELPWPGVIWASHRGAERYGQEATRADPRRD